MPDLNFSISQIAILVIVFGAGMIDIRTTKIYNVITFPAAAIGIIVNAMMGGWQAALMAVAGWFLAVLIMVFPDRKRKMAFGDAKLMAAVGAFLGPGGVLLAFFYFSLCYGLIAFYKFVRAFPWMQFFKLFKLLGPNVGVAHESMDTEGLSKTMKASIPLGPAIAIGTLLAIVLQKQTLQFMGFHDTVLFGMPMILSNLTNLP